jgi:hypothetical protein
MGSRGDAGAHDGARVDDDAAGARANGGSRDEAARRQRGRDARGDGENTRGTVGRSLDALRRAGLVEALLGRASPERYVVSPVAVDTSTATEAERRTLKLHWADVGRARLSEGKPGLFSWSVFAIGREDFARLQALHVDYLQALRRLVDASEPTELVAVANVQLFALDGRS